MSMIGDKILNVICYKGNVNKTIMRHHCTLTRRAEFQKADSCKWVKPLWKTGSMSSS